MCNVEKIKSTALITCMCVFMCTCVYYLSISGRVVDQTGMFSGAAQLGNGFCLTYHPPHALQMTILQQTRTHVSITSSHISRCMSKLQCDQISI